METFPVRLMPGADLRRTLESILEQRGCRAGFVLAGIGSLSQARLRFAGRDQPETFQGDLEILTLAGSLSPDGAHLHMSVADSAGRVMGGHVATDCLVRTTAEVLLGLLPEWEFARERDPGTGFAELTIRKFPERET